jgi:O-antigen/teichoic acid export membrane protein
MNARSISKFKGQNTPQLIPIFHNKMLLYMTLGGLIAFVIFSLLSGHIANFLHIDSTMLVIWIGLIFFICWILPVNCGTMQGLQRFNHLALMNLLPALFKLLIGVGLVVIGFGIYGAVGGLVLGIFFNLIVSFYLLRDIINWRVLKTSFNFLSSANSNEKDISHDLANFSARDIKIEIKDAFRFSLPVLFAIVCVAIPTNIDVVLIKHFFTSVDAGLFTAVSVFGRIIFSFPVAITTVMYPKVVEAHTKNKETRALLNRSLLYTGIPAGLLALVFWILPKFFLGIFYGEEFLGAVLFLRFYGVFIFFFSLATILIYNSLAKNQYGYICLFAVFSILELGLIWLYHSSLILIIQIFLFMSIILFVVGLFFNYYSRANKMVNHNIE